ncbi:protein mono-ADP-ribosyltransferase PARP16 isoform X2 [Folsomia candida]|nr:protein mono-ADP-ribosyltransferase PARP16 isoform X2 [Folsomia candida]
MQRSQMADELYHLLDYRQLVLEIILDGKKITRIVCELRMSLFVKAVMMSDQRPQCLMPFPSSFFNPVTKEKQFGLLKETIAVIPPLQDITEDKQLPRMAWELLHWVFTNPLTIEAITENIPATLEALKLQMNLTDISPRFITSAEPFLLFKVTPSVPKTSFDAEKVTHGSFFAYHGSPLENFHSIIHRGLKNELNIRKAYGHGTYLSSTLKVSKGYSTGSEAWGHSALMTPHVDVGLELLRKEHLQCVAIVEVVNHPNLKKHKVGGDGTHYYVVEKDEWLQLSHLIVYVISHFM